MDVNRQYWSSCRQGPTTTNTSREDSNPQSGGGSATTVTVPLPMNSKNGHDAVMSCMSPTVRKLVQADRYNIGFVVQDICSLQHDTAIASIRNPTSTCRAAAIVILDPPPTSVSVLDNSTGFATTTYNASEQKIHSQTTTPTATALSLQEQEQKQQDNDNSNKNNNNEGMLQLWLDKNRIHREETNVLFGEDGFAAILQDATIDAVYIFVSDHLQSQYALAALNAGKHVLLKDVTSTPCKDYREQLKVAKRMGKFIQFSTMFVHHHRVQSFLSCVGSKKTFGVIREIDAILTVNLQDLQLLGVSLPLTAGQGCVRRLARYCVLIASLILNVQAPIRATVEKHVLDETSQEPLWAQCRVDYADGAVLHCQVVYSDAPTRQVLTVRSDLNRFATMTDFVIAHPDGLATYRVYNKERNNLTGKMDMVQGGECIDVPTGAPQNVTLWREFHSLCCAIETHGWIDDDTNNNNENKDVDKKDSRMARILTEASLQTKRILAALDISVRSANNATVNIRTASGDDDDESLCD